MKEIFCVCVDAGGAHEAECVYSIWDDLKKAELEAERLNQKAKQEAHFSLGCYDGEAYVLATTGNESRNEWIG